MSNSFKISQCYYCRDYINYMLSTTQQVIAFYSKIINDPLLLANGYQLVKDYLFTSQQNRRNTIANILHPHVPILNLIGNTYPQQIFNSDEISTEQKAQTIQFLINLLVIEVLKQKELFNKRIVQNLFSFLHKIHNIVGFESSVVYYAEALQRLIENQSDKFGFFVLSILKDGDDRVNIFSRNVLGLVVGSQWIPNPQQQLQILYHCLKSMAILNDSDPDTLEEYYKIQTQDKIMKYVMTFMKHSIRTMKFSLKILTILFGDYQMQSSKPLILQIQNTTRALVAEYLGYLNRGSNLNCGGDIEIGDDEEDNDPIEIALYQTLELYMTLFGNGVQVNCELVVYLCVICTFLGEGHYRQFVSKSDQYLMQIQDQGSTNIRNKSIYFIEQILTGQQNAKFSKKCKQMLTTYINDILSNITTINNKVTTFLTRHQLPSVLLRVSQIYTQSALFILYSFTQQLLINPKNPRQLCLVLVNQIKNSPSNAIDVILSTTILNKLIKLQGQNQQKYYLIFIRQQVYKFINNIGMLLALVQGFYSFSPIQQLLISQQPNINIPLPLIQTLLLYLMRNDLSQNQFGYKVLQFILHLCKCSDNKSRLLQLVSHQMQLKCLSIYLHDGIAAPIAIDLVAQLGNPLTIAAIYKAVQNGSAVDENLPLLISKCMLNHSFALEQTQLLQLIQIYYNKLDLLSDIISAFLQTRTLNNEQLIALLNANLNNKWLPGLLRQNKANNIQQLFLNSVIKITDVLTSQYELECQLMMPYVIFLKNMNEAINLLIQQGIFQKFFSKLYNYAKLFKGTHLKIITGHVFCECAFIRREMIPKVVQLIQSYGKIESDEWQEQEEVADMEDTINKLFMKLNNEEVEESFKKTFGELSWDSSLLFTKFNSLKALV